MKAVQDLIRDNFTLFALLLTTALMLLASEVIHLHATSFEYVTSEQSIIERSQDVALVLMMVISFAAAWRNGAWREVFVAIGAVAAMMLIREQNNWFKAELFRGAWQIAVAMVFVPLAFWLFPRFERFRLQLVHLCQIRYSVSGLVGLFILLVYSRLFGRKAIWEGVLGENFIYSAKMVIEESIELLGYSLMLAAVIKLSMYITLNAQRLMTERVLATSSRFHYAVAS